MQTRVAVDGGGVHFGAAGQQGGGHREVAAIECQRQRGVSEIVLQVGLGAGAQQRAGAAGLSEMHSQMQRSALLATLVGVRCIQCGASGGQRRYGFGSSVACGQVQGGGAVLGQSRLQWRATGRQGCHHGGMALGGCSVQRGPAVGGHLGGVRAARQQRLDHVRAAIDRGQVERRGGLAVAGQRERCARCDQPFQHVHPPRAGRHVERTPAGSLGMVGVAARGEQSVQNRQLAGEARREERGATVAPGHPYRFRILGQQSLQQRQVTVDPGKVEVGGAGGQRRDRAPRLRMLAQQGQRVVADPQICWNGPTVRYVAAQNVWPVRQEFGCLVQVVFAMICQSGVCAAAAVPFLRLVADDAGQAQQPTLTVEPAAGGRPVPQHGFVYQLDPVPCLGQQQPALQQGLRQPPRRGVARHRCVRQQQPVVGCAAQTHQPPHEAADRVVGPIGTGQRARLLDRGIGQLRDGILDVEQAFAIVQAQTGKGGGRAVSVLGLRGCRSVRLRRGRLSRRWRPGRRVRDAVRARLEDPAQRQGHQRKQTARGFPVAPVGKAHDALAQAAHQLWLQHGDTGDLEGFADDLVEAVLRKRQAQVAAACPQRAQRRILGDQFGAVGLQGVDHAHGRMRGGAHDEVHHWCPGRCIFSAGAPVEQLLELVEGQQQPPVPSACRQRVAEPAHGLLGFVLVAHRGQRRSGLLEGHRGIDLRQRKGVEPWHRIGQEFIRAHDAGQVVALGGLVAQVAHDAGTRERGLAHAAAADHAVEGRAVRVLPERGQLGHRFAALGLAAHEHRIVVAVVDLQALERVAHGFVHPQVQLAGQEGTDLFACLLLVGHHAREDRPRLQEAQQVAQLHHLRQVVVAFPGPVCGAPACAMRFLEALLGRCIETLSAPVRVQRVEILAHRLVADHQQQHRRLAALEPRVPLAGLAHAAGVVGLQRCQVLEHGAGQGEAAVLLGPGGPGMDQLRAAAAVACQRSQRPGVEVLGQRRADPLAQQADHRAAVRVRGQWDLALRRHPVAKAVLGLVDEPVVELQAVVVGHLVSQCVELARRGLAQVGQIAWRSDEDRGVGERREGPHGGRLPGAWGDPDCGRSAPACGWAAGRIA